MTDPPGGCDEQEADRQQGIAMPGDALPEVWPEMEDGCQGNSREQAVQPGVGRIIDPPVIGLPEPFVFGGLQDRLQKMIPVVEPGGEAQYEKSRQEPYGFMP